MKYVHEYAKPFFYEGNDIGCLLIHGFTASPAQMRLLGEELHREGYTVSGILLKGHGTCVEDMEQTTWKDWLKTAHEEYGKLRSRCKKVYVMGLSMGGILSLILAETYPVDKVIAIDAPIRVQDKLTYLTPIAKYFKKYSEWKEGPLGENELGHPYSAGYPKAPLKCVPHLLTLIRTARKGLGSITCPIMVIQSRKDETVEPISAEIIYQGAVSKHKEILWLDRSKHVCTLGPEREYMHKKIVAFLAQ